LPRPARLDPRPSGSPQSARLSPARPRRVAMLERRKAARVRERRRARGRERVGGPAGRAARGLLGVGLRASGLSAQAAAGGERLPKEETPLVVVAARVATLGEERLEARDQAANIALAKDAPARVGALGVRRRSKPAAAEASTRPQCAPRL